MSRHYDLLVIGGGINGCGIARDAAGRGYSVCLAEMNDLASGTSSWSTKLIHGGLRYLEHYEFRLVREALIEREVLLRMAPHIIWPLRFVLPHHDGMRPAWLLRLGLFLYDHLGGRKLLPATDVVDLRSDSAGRPLKSEFSKAFEYSDCWVNDARLVVLNAMDAQARGAEIHTRTKVVSAKRKEAEWEVSLQSVDTGAIETVGAKLLINAGGPWVDDILQTSLGHTNADNVRLVQGSHIVVRRKFDHPKAYFFQNTDERIFFAIPYEQDFTLIGTTDQDYHGPLSDVRISEQEIDYLCEGASAYFREPVTRDDIVWTFSGVRPLYDDGASKAQEATRDYVLRVDGESAQAKVINVFGGKITTYRRLAESMLEKVEATLGAKGRPWTRESALPGGDFAVTGFDALLARLRATFPFLGTAQSERLARCYGLKVFEMLDAAGSAADLGTDFGHGLTEVEVRYLIAHEWARTAEDVAWRRTKLGIRFSPEQMADLQAFMDINAQPRQSAAERG
ncbi:glycerol-3-phosphate dehydrogenase [Pseudohoeflea coraliihabitans]|uniref:Glycerol-3-phosphate dehydrogenase n=1 Tax=Pseudohoeflea coraliihabitans TaxID=2860393 RepID=A0ABS6WRL3_9HYPH|nr:glycerol-3-phosphate dehydrogenase [Pseudohoeflea sp. DP4N28-3]MBW3098575.1 glycerol-3-phosphate dehydrogenase [Pseudohoeflea sp. DP4N28-3]